MALVEQRDGLAPLRREVTVRDCMFWPDPSQKHVKTQDTLQTLFVLPSKGALGKPSTRNFNLPEGTTCYGAPVVDDGCHVVDALRGWPNRAPTFDPEMEVVLADVMQETKLEEEARKRKKKKASKSKH